MFVRNHLIIESFIGLRTMSKVLDSRLVEFHIELDVSYTCGSLSVLGSAELRRGPWITSKYKFLAVSSLGLNFMQSLDCGIVHSILEERLRSVVFGFNPQLEIYTDKKE